MDINQNWPSGKQPALAMHLEIWHRDIFTVLDMIRERLAGAIQYNRSAEIVLWIPDILQVCSHKLELCF